MTELTSTCSICKAEVRAETCDVGVGYRQVGPFHCDRCDWVEGCPCKDTCPGMKCTSWEICQIKFNKSV